MIIIKKQMKESTQYNINSLQRELEGRHIRFMISFFLSTCMALYYYFFMARPN